MSRKVRSAIALSLSALLLSAGTLPALAAQEPQLNFKIYNPEGTAAPAADNNDFFEEPGAKKNDAPSTPSHFSIPMTDSLETEVPQLDEGKKKQSKPVDSAGTTDGAAAAKTESTSGTASSGGDQAASTPAANPGDNGSEGTSSIVSGSNALNDPAPKSDKVLKGYVRVVPTGTRIPIVMDTAVDSDTSQEGDEFSARTSEDLSIDGSTVVPAGSIIKGRIAQINAPKHLNRSGSVGLKFDTVTTPDGRQIPLVANLVARRGVVHARRGLKDIAFDTGAVTLPTVAGLAIGALAGKSNNSTSSSSGSSHITKAEGAMIGVGVGLAIGVAVLLAKKGKKVEVKPGDELKIELAEDLRMPSI